MDITRGNANLEIFFTQCRVEWTEAMNAAKENLILNKIATQVTSTSTSTRHAWLNQLPAMRKWVGDRKINNLQSNTLNVTNDKFENLIEITREEFEDDVYQLYAPLFPIMGRQAVATKDRLLIDALLQGDTAGTAGNLWGGDSAAVFGTTRKYGDATISNKTTTAFDSAGAALTANIKTMRSYLGHSGQPLMVRPVALLFGPNLYDTAHKAVKNNYTALATGATAAAGYVSHVGGDIMNPNANIVDLVITEYLVDNYVDVDGNTAYSNAGKAYFTIGEAMGVRAGLIYQSRIEPELQDQRARLDASNSELFLQDKLQWGVRMRGKAFVGLPHLVIGNFPTSYGS